MQASYTGSGVARIVHYQQPGTAAIAEAVSRIGSDALSAVVNGAATIMMVVFIDPQMSVMTDDVVEGRTTESHFRRAVIWLVGSRLAGTLLAQLILVPAAMLIVGVAQIV